MIANRYTSTRKLAISDGSNGGLLVGAVLNQRPELFGAAVPAVGVMDMLRFNKYTIGWAWVSDYGSPDDPEMFPVLRAYSPLHNIKAGWRRWYRNWRNHLVRFIGWLTIQKWTKAFKKDNFIQKLEQAKQHLKKSKKKD